MEDDAGHVAGAEGIWHIPDESIAPTALIATKLAHFNCAQMRPEPKKPRPRRSEGPRPTLGRVHKTIAGRERQITELRSRTIRASLNPRPPCVAEALTL